MSDKLLIIAGEASGDLHGSELIKELHKLDNSIKIFGIGGDKMKNAGMTIKYHINEMSFLGFVEVLKHLPFIRRVKKSLIQLAVKENIKNVVLIDYPGFNLSIAKSFHNLGLKNIYYISPQIWAWGHGRINKIKKLISRMIVLFPFEEKLYREHEVSADFVGHPLVKSIDEYIFLTRDQLIEKYNLDSEKDILLLLPGSRLQELDKILKIMLEASDKISKRFNMQTLIACADNIDKNIFNKYQSSHSFKLIKGDTYNLLKHSKFSIVKSGTSTLEAGIIGNPFLVVYKTNIMTYWIGKALVKIKNIALVNIVAEKNIVKELIQDQVTPNNIFKEAVSLLSYENNYNKLKTDLSIIKEKLNTSGNPSKMAAELIYSELNGNKKN